MQGVDQAKEGNGSVARDPNFQNLNSLVHVSFDQRRRDKAPSTQSALLHLVSREIPPSHVAPSLEHTRQDCIGAFGSLIWPSLCHPSPPTCRFSSARPFLATAFQLAVVALPRALKMF